MLGCQFHLKFIRVFLRLWCTIEMFLLKFSTETPLVRQLAPPPTPLQSFEYHWKHVKNFYAQYTVMPKVHIENTNLPTHLEEMLKLLIEEDYQANESTTAHANATPKTVSAAAAPVPNTSGTSKKECFEFVIANRPLDLLTDICLTDSPVGASVCVLNWMRRFLTCLQHPRLDHKSILQPIQVRRRWKHFDWTVHLSLILITSRN